MINEKLIFVLFAFIFGSIIGSFLNVLIYRLPRGKTPWKPIYSFCPSCKKTIRWYDNIPILSYILLRGRCRFCGYKIPLQYLIVEVLSGFASVLAFFKTGISVDYIFVFFFLASMIVVSFIDFEFKIILDKVNYTGFGVGIIYAFFRKDFTVFDAFLGAVLGAGILYTIAYLYKKYKKIEGLGLGDVKFLLFIGSFVGWFGAIFTIFMGSLLGTVIALAGALSSDVKDKAKYEIPFGPYLAIAGSIYILVGEKIKYWYFHI